MNPRSLIAVLAVCGIVVTSAAQTPQDVKLDLRAPGDEHRRLDQLAGSWNVTLKIPIAQGRQIEGKASCDAKWVMDGRNIRAHSEEGL